MRRRLRIIEWAGLGISALLLLATLVLWPWSYRQQGTLLCRTRAPEARNFSQQTYSIFWNKGHLGYEFVDHAYSKDAYEDYVRHFRGGHLGPKHGDRPSRSGLHMTSEAPETCFEIHWGNDFYFTGNSTPPARDDVLSGEEWEGVFHKIGVHWYRPWLVSGERYVKWKGRVIAMHCWIPTTVFSILPALALRRFIGRRRQKQRVRRGLCVKCGYDLRATPDPDGPRLPRCPECGAIPAKGGR